MRVLIVGAYPAWLASLSLCFSAAGYDVLSVDDVVRAKAEILRDRPDLVILELDERSAGGCRQIRRISQVPMIALCAGNERDLIAALDQGADVCLAMPCDYDVLLAHSRALLRQCEWTASPA